MKTEAQIEIENRIILFFFAMFFIIGPFALLLFLIFNPNTEIIDAIRKGQEKQENFENSLRMHSNSNEKKDFSRFINFE